MTLKTIAKKSAFLHGGYKLLRRANDVPASKWGNLGQLADMVRVLPNTMLPLPRLFDAGDAISTINAEGLEGDIAECGVWNGGCVGLMALANEKHPRMRRKFHLFDSFEGLPQPSVYDLEVNDGFDALYGSKPVAIGACVGISQTAVEDFLVRRLGLDGNIFVFHVGWFQDTVQQAATEIQELALLRLDGDWYDSTKVCLENLYDKVVKTGYVIIDDYGTFSGCRKAVDEFLESRAIKPKIIHSDSECIFFRKP